MKINSLLVGIVLMGFTVFCSGAENMKSVRATKRLAENVISLVKENSIEEAFAQLKEYWPLAPGEVDDLMAHTKEQRQVVSARFGKPLRVEFVRTDAIGDSMVRHVFIEKFEKHALRWQLSFYKPADSWIVNSIYWDDKISDLYS